MAGLIPQSFIDDLLHRTDIVEIIGARVSLKKAGKNFNARCPFHQEKTPSFSVSPDKQFYYCFGCGAGGNALGFVMDHDHLDFPEAVTELAKRAGLEVPRTEQGGGTTPRIPVDAPIYALLAKASAFYRQMLKIHPARTVAVDYLKNRGLSGAIARDFALGFAPPGWDQLLKHLGGDALQKKAMLEAGLLVTQDDSGKTYDRFRDRIMFPIRDTRGRVIAFGGRVLNNDKPKYLNSPETPVFQKSQELYGLYEARQHSRQLDEIMVVEGYLDVIALAQHGLRNAVATLGTATSSEHVKRLFRLVPSIVFCFDGDSAGRKAAWRALEATLPHLSDGCRVHFLFLPEGSDPDSLIRAEGSEAFRKRLTQATPLAEYFFNQLTEDTNPSSLEGKAHLAMVARPLINQVSGEILRTLMEQHLSTLTGLPIASQIMPLATPAAARSPATTDSISTAPPPVKALRSNKKPMQHAVEHPVLMALRILLQRPTLACHVAHAEIFAEENDPIAQLLVALLKSLQKKPEQTAVHLLARWHGTKQGHLLRALAEKECLIKEQNLEKQFLDIINIMITRKNIKQLDSLLRKVKNTPLDAKEKVQLQALLKRPE